MMSGNKNIQFSEDETIRGVADSCTLLRNAFSESDDIIADVSAIRETDVSFVQLVESARKTADACKKKFSMKVPATGPLLEVLQRGGFLESRENVSFWLCE